jgi:hypothetical protein
MNGITRPYRRDCPAVSQRQLCLGTVTVRSQICLDPETYVRGFRRLPKDLEHLFEYVFDCVPPDQNHRSAS